VSSITSSLKEILAIINGYPNYANPIFLQGDACALRENVRTLNFAEGMARAFDSLLSLNQVLKEVPLEIR
jgi:hypothetical protein